MNLRAMVPRLVVIDSLVHLIAILVVLVVIVVSFVIHIFDQR